MLFTLSHLSISSVMIYLTSEILLILQRNTLNPLKICHFFTFLISFSSTDILTLLRYNTPNVSNEEEIMPKPYHFAHHATLFAGTFISRFTGTESKLERSKNWEPLPNPTSGRYCETRISNMYQFLFS